MIPPELLPILRYVIPLTVLISGGASWLLKLWLEHRFRTGAEKALSEFKHHLDGAAAAAAFDYQRRLQDYNLFVTKKHEVIPELHALFCTARSEVALFAEAVVTFSMEDEYTSRVRKNAMAALNNLSGYLRARELYLSEEIAAECNRVYLALSESFKAAHGGHTAEGSEAYRQKFHVLTLLMKAELGRSELHERADPARLRPRSSSPDASTPTTPNESARTRDPEADDPSGSGTSSS